MQKIKFSISILAIVMCTATIVNAQFTRQQAIDTVLNHVVAADTSKTDIFAATRLFNINDRLITYTLDTLQVPYNDCFVFFVYDYPFANWEHLCRYLFMDAASGNIMSVEEMSYPDDLYSTYELIYQMQRPQSVTPEPFDPSSTSEKATPNPHLYAVLIAGYLNDQNPYDPYRFSNDLCMVYNALIDAYGYTEENIFVHFRDGNGTNENYLNNFNGDQNIDDIDYPAFKPRVEETFANLAGISNSDPLVPELVPGDMLFVYVSGHGGAPSQNRPSYFISLAVPNDPTHDEPFYDTELEGYVEDINCSQMIFLMNTCNAGGFLDNLEPDNDWPCQKIEAYTSASEDESGWAEMYITNGWFEEFSYYWCAAVRGYYPNTTHPYMHWYKVGEFPFDEYDDIIDGGHDFDDYDPDENADGYVSMEEALIYADYNDCWSDDTWFGGYYNPPESWPIGIETPQQNYWLIDIIVLNGYAGECNSTNFEEGIYLIGGTLSGNLHIDDNIIFLFGTDNAEILAENLYVDNGVTFVVENAIKPTKLQQGLITGTNTTLISDGCLWNIYLDGSQMQTSISSTTFENCKLHNYGASINVEGCSFTACDQLSSSYGDVSINNCNFVNTSIYLSDINPIENNAIITGSNFSASTSPFSIQVWGYDNFTLTGNTITGLTNGISVFNSGFGQQGNQLISENSISGCSSAGILAYNSYCNIYSNTIDGNYYGVRLLGNGDVALGTPSVVPPGTPYQEIADNTSYEVYASINMFPHYFKYNVIIDEDNAGNPSDALVYTNFDDTDENERLDVRYNCWGASFSAADDLFPVNMYYYTPTWCPGDDDGETEASEILLQSGLDDFKNSQYQSANLTFLAVVNQYPQTTSAEAAMKELLRVEKYLNKDYAGLQHYYLTDNVIQSDSILADLGLKLANVCNLKLQNWDDAIVWYEQIIQNPPSYHDSIFAIVDLGYTYLLMENNGYKSGYTGKMEQYKPVNGEQYQLNRNYLLSLLPGDLKEQSKHHTLKTPNDTHLYQNTPNPVTNSTSIGFKIPVAAMVTVKLFDYTGHLIGTLMNTEFNAGSHSIPLNASTLNPGIYFYSLEVDGKRIMTKKMSIL